jgi:hypothetical protein
MSTDLRYPVGKFQRPESISAAGRAAFIDEIRALPANLRAAVAGLTGEQLDTPYRPGGWTVRQVVHHVADSHMNSYVRFRLALTEDEPVIKAYEEQLWAELADARSAPAELSLALIDMLHARWIILLESLDDAAFGRTFRHPAIGLMTLDANTALYAWHSRHHVAHITSLRRRMGWD